MVKTAWSFVRGKARHGLLLFPYPPLNKDSVLWSGRAGGTGGPRPRLRRRRAGPASSLAGCRSNVAGGGAGARPPASTGLASRCCVRIDCSEDRFHSINLCVGPSAPSTIQARLAQLRY